MGTEHLLGKSCIWWWTVELAWTYLVLSCTSPLSCWQRLWRSCWSCFGGFWAFQYPCGWHWVVPFLLVNPGASQVLQSGLAVLQFPPSGVSANSFLGPTHALTHVPIHLGCYDASQELPCCAEAGYCLVLWKDWFLLEIPGDRDCLGVLCVFVVSVLSLSKSRTWTWPSVVLELLSAWTHLWGNGENTRVWVCLYSISTNAIVVLWCETAYLYNRSVTFVGVTACLLSACV